MARNILNSDRVVVASVQVVRAFVRLRSLVSTRREVAAQLAELDSHLAKHYDEIDSIFETIRQLMTPPVSKTSEIGFRSKGWKK